MEELIYVDRRNSNCNKWDGQTAMFGEELFLLPYGWTDKMGK